MNWTELVVSSLGPDWQIWLLVTLAVSLILLFALMLWRLHDQRLVRRAESLVREQGEVQYKRIVETLHQGLERQSDRLMFQSSHVADRMGDALAQPPRTAARGVRLAAVGAVGLDEYRT